MGGLLIIGSVVFSSILWGDFSNRFLLVSLLCLFLFALLGFADDFKKVTEKIQKVFLHGLKSLFQLLFSLIISAVLYFYVFESNELNYIVPFL